MAVWRLVGRVRADARIEQRPVRAVIADHVAATDTEHAFDGPGSDWWGGKRDALVAAAATAA